MTTKNLVIGLAVLVVVLGAWTVYAGKGVPWHQQNGQGPEQKRRAQPKKGQQGQGQSGAQHHDEGEEGEGDPADWTEEELKAYLENVRLTS